jgi:hypothetical protein
MSICGSLRTAMAKARVEKERARHQNPQQGPASKRRAFDLLHSLQYLEAADN